MSIDALLTLLALGLAVYAVVPEERRLDIRLRLGRSGWGIIVVTFLVLHWIKFRPVLEKAGLPATVGQWPFGLDDETGSYLVFLAAVIALVVSAKTLKLSSSQIPIFREFVERLILERRFAQVAHLLEVHLGRVRAVVSRGTGWVRFRRLIEPAYSFTHEAPDGAIVFEQRPDPNTPLNRRRATIAIRLPSENDSTAAADELLHRVYTNADVVGEIARTRPRLGLRMLDSDQRGKDFLVLLARSWLDASTSALYYEIRNNQELLGHSRYRIPASNPILHTLLGNSRRAADLAVYKAFGDDALRELERRHALEDDPYLGPLQTYYDEDRWHCRLHATLSVFDIMVSEAIYQRIDWHMWLYYSPDFVKAIIANLRSTPSGVDLSREWPTPYHCLLYLIVDMHRSWIDSIRHLPPGQPNAVVRATAPDVDFDENILESAISSVGQCFYHILNATGLDTRFKAYLLDIHLRLCEDLARTPSGTAAANALARSLARGGPDFGRSKVCYREQLVQACTQVDQALLFGLRKLPELGSLIR